MQTVNNGADQSVYSYSLEARDHIPGSSAVKVQQFHGTVTMVKENNTWRIGEMSAQKIGEKVE